MDLKENLVGLEHVGMPTADIEKTIAFYESLGFAVALRTAIPEGGKVAFLPDENPTTDLMDGITRFRVYLAPPPPAKEIWFTLQYEPSYLGTLFQ